MALNRHVLAILALLASLSPPGAGAAGFRLDPTFGADGIAILPYTSARPEAVARDLDVDPDGKLIVAGDYVTGAIFGGVLRSAFITRLDGRGVPDPQFFGGSITRAPTPRVLVQRNGEVLAGSGNSDGPLARYRLDGSLDHAFTGNAAAAIASVNPTFMFFDFVLQPDGKVVLLGSYFKGSGFPGLTLLRLRADGTLDPTFANGRDVFAASPWTYFAYFNALAQYPDGRLAVAVESQRTPLNRGIAIARVRADGQPDATFGTQGVLDFSAQSVGVSEVSPFIAADSRARLVVAFTRVGQDWQEVSLRRLREDGSADVTFGTQGEVVAQSGPQLREIGALAMAPDDSIFVAAGERTGAMQLLRLTAEGIPDATLGPSGVLASPLDKIYRIALTPAGAIAVAGRLAADPSRAAVARFTEGTIPAIEFHHAASDHYFITADPLEIRDLDDGFHPGWQRTGSSFAVVGASANETPALRPVCRFYIPPAKGDSHFFSASAAECAGVAERSRSDPNYAGIALETPTAFLAGLPDAVTGTCPGGMTPVYRLWNQRADSNHRYTTRPDLREAMIARGYLAEGYGPDGVGMCSPP